MRVLCRVWQRRNKRVGGADDERIIIDRSWLSACKQRCTEPVPWNLSIPWSIKKCKNSSRYGRSRCLCYHDFFVCNGADLPVILVPLHFEYLQTIVFILVIAALVQFVEMFLKKAMPPLYQALGVYLPLITTNCAVLGVALTNVQKSYSIGAGVVNGVATAVGFLIAIVLMAGIREKIEYNDVPESFQGTPIVLVTAGLMAIAFFGFSGLI